MSNQILTEEELKGIDNELYHYLEIELVMKLKLLIASHRTLNSRNAKLVHENDELMAENEMRKNNELKLLKAMRQIISNTVSEDVLDIAETVILDITNSTLEELNHE